MYSGEIPCHVIPYPYHARPYHTPIMLCHIIPLPCHAIPTTCHVIPLPCHAIPYPYHAIPLPCHTIPIYAMPYHTHTMPCHTIPLTCHCGLNSLCLILFWNMQTVSFLRMPLNLNIIISVFKIMKVCCLLSGDSW